MDIKSILLKNTHLYSSIIDIVEEFCNTVFVLDICGIYLFDGKSVELYKDIAQASCTNLVYTTGLGLCYKEGQEIKHIDFKDNDSIKEVWSNEKLQFKIIYDLVGGNKLYFIAYGVIYTINKERYSKIGKPFSCYDNSTFVFSNNSIISIGGTLASTAPSSSIESITQRLTNNSQSIPTIIYNISSNTVKNAPPLLNNRSRFASLVLGNYIYTFGGSIIKKGELVRSTNKSKDRGPLDFLGLVYEKDTIVDCDIVERFSLIRHTWHACASMPNKVKDISAITIGKYIYILGCDPSMRYEPNTNVWELVEDFIFNPKCSTASITF